MKAAATTWTTARGSAFEAEVRRSPLFGREIPAELLDWARGDAAAARGEAPTAEPPPALRRLAAELRAELLEGSGAAWLRHPAGRPFDAAAARALFAHLGASAGTSVGAYGRLFPVTDTGGSYVDQAIPVSMTAAATGQHTDSSNRGVLPHCVALLCERASGDGGESMLSSVPRAARNLARTAPALLERLGRDFVRDLVTPDAVRDREHVLANRFPVLCRDATRAGWTLRYMRYWIERGHELVGEPLEPLDREALDALDRELSRPENTVRMRLEAGDQLWIDNRGLAHGRSEYRDGPGKEGAAAGEGPAAGRLLWRQWLAFGED